MTLPIAVQIITNPVAAISSAVLIGAYGNQREKTRAIFSACLSYFAGLNVGLFLATHFYPSAKVGPYLGNEEVNKISWVVSNLAVWSIRAACASVNVSALWMGAKKLFS